jgi:hypothetical protein
MPNWKKVITSGSDASLNTLIVSNGITGSLLGTASYALTAGNGGVTQLLAGPNVTLSPTNGLGQVTISSTSGGGGFNTATGSYGSFYSTQIQTNVAGTARSMSLNITDITNGVSISGSTNPFNTYIKTENAGVYDIQFSAQVDKTDSGTDEIWIWLRKNGTDISDSATSVQLVGNGAHYVAAWNFFVNSAANDYYQLMWYSPDANVRLHAEAGFGVVPGIPSLIVTANRVDQFLSNTGSFSGSFTGILTGTASYATQALLSTNVIGSANRILFNNGTNTTTTSNELTWTDGTNLLTLGSVAGTAGTISKLALYTSSFGGYGFGVSPSQLDYVTDGSHVFYKNGTTPTESLRITSTGDVGIGTTTPTSKLDVAVGVNTFRGIRQAYIGLNSDFSNGDYPGIWFNQTNRTVSNYAFLADGVDTIFNAPTTGTLNFRINNGNKLRVFETGNIIIQNGGAFTDAGFRLDVQGTTRFNGNSLVTGSLNVTGGITGSLLGTASTASYVVTAQTASYVTLAQTASYITTAQTASYVLNAVSASLVTSIANLISNNTNDYVLTSRGAGTIQGESNLTFDGSTLNILGNTLITGSLTVGTGSLGASENTITLGARDSANEGGQIGFNAPGGTWTSASFIDNWSNFHRILVGTNASSTGLVTQWNLQTKQMQLPAYTAASSFPGTATANLAVDSGGNIITVSTSGGTVFPYTGNAVITGSLTTTGIIYAQPNGGMYFQGGDDAALYDINVVNTMGVYGVQTVTEGAIRLGSNGITLHGSGSKLGIGTTNPSSASLTVNGNVWATSFTGSLLGTASYATQALSASYAPSTPTFPYTGSAIITGSLSVTGTTIAGFNPTPRTGSIRDGVTSVLGDLQNWNSQYYSGEVLYSEVSKEALNFGQLCWRDRYGQWGKAIGDVIGEPAKNMLGICLHTTDTSDEATSILTRGYVETTYLAAGRSGDPLFIDATTAGSITETAPSTAGNVVRLIGNIFWSNGVQTNSKWIVYFNPDNTWIEL